MQFAFAQRRVWDAATPIASCRRATRRLCAPAAAVDSVLPQQQPKDALRIVIHYDDDSRKTCVSFETGTTDARAVATVRAAVLQYIMAPSDDDDGPTRIDVPLLHRATLRDALVRPESYQALVIRVEGQELAADEVQGGRGGSRR